MRTREILFYLTKLNMFFIGNAWKRVDLTSWILKDSCVLHKWRENTENHSLLRSVVSNQLDICDIFDWIWMNGRVRVLYISWTERKINSFRSACLQTENSRIEEVNLFFTCLHDQKSNLLFREVIKFLTMFHEKPFVKTLKIFTWVRCDTANCSECCSANLISMASMLQWNPLVTSTKWTSHRRMSFLTQSMMQERVASRKKATSPHRIELWTSSLED